MKAVSKKIKEGVYWVGVLDWDIRKYHGYTLKGTSHNAYLVFGDEKVALIDNAYPGNFPELMARVEDAFGKEGKEVKIDVIIQNHVEKDTAAFYQNYTKNPGCTCICTENSSRWTT
jgi:flavorubredoxin